MKEPRTLEDDLARIEMCLITTNAQLRTEPGERTLEQCFRISDDVDRIMALTASLHQLTQKNLMRGIAKALS
jgi:hypothetical protein